MIKQRIKNFAAVLLLVAAQAGAVLLPAQQAFAAGMTCTWTGAVNANWNNSGNWTGCSSTVPVNDDTIILSASGANKAIVNDAVGVNVRQIVVDPGATGYSISSQALTISQYVTAAESLTFNNAITLGTGGADFPGLRASAGRTITLAAAVTMNNNQAIVGDVSYPGTVDFVGDISGTGGLYSDNGGKAIVRGASNVFTGTLVGASRNGTFDCRSVSCFGNAANTVFINGGSVNLYTMATYAHSILVASDPDNDSWLNAHENISLQGNVTVNDPLGISQSVASKNLQFLSGNVTLNQNISLFGADTTSIIKFDGHVTGSGGISAGGGTTQLSHNGNDYGGDTTVNDGAVVEISKVNSLGNSSVGTTVLDGGSLVTKVTGATTIAEPLSIAGSGVSATQGALHNNAALLADTPTLTGALTLASDATITNSGVSTLHVNGVVSGSHNLTVYAGDDGANDPGIEFGGASPNTYTGTTTVTGGAVYGDKTGALPGDLTIHTAAGATRAYFFVTADNAVADTAKVSLNTVDDSFILNNAAQDETIGGLSGPAGDVEFVNSGRTLVIDQDHDSTFDGGFYSDGGTNTVEKRGSGKLTLNGDIYNAGDDISFVATEGVLSVNGSLRTTGGSGNVTVQSGATLKGTGTVGAVTIQNGGLLAPGNSPGTLNVTDLTLAGSGTHQVEITSDSAYDRINATGTVTLGGTLTVLPTYTPAVGTQFVIVQAGVVTGTFNGLADGAELTANGLRFRIDYVGNGVVLTYLGGTLAIPGAPNTGFALQSGVPAYVVAGIAGAALLFVLACSPLRGHLVRLARRVQQ